MEPVQKLTLIKQLGFMELLASIQIRFPNFSFDEDQDEQDEEKSFLIAVSTAVSKLGKQLLEYFYNEDKVFNIEDELQQYYCNVVDFMVKKSCELLNSDKLEIVWPVVDFIAGWLQANMK